MATQPAAAEPRGERLKKDARNHKRPPAPPDELERSRTVRLAGLAASHTAVLYHGVITAP